MISISKRNFLAGGVALTGAVMASGLAPFSSPAKASPPQFPPVVPISKEEYQARTAKLRQLMAKAGISAFVVEAGSSLRYFTGIQWSRSERLTGAIIPVDGDPVVITPYFEESRARETVTIPAEFRTWNEHENPEVLMAGVLRDHKITSGKIAIEPTVRYFIVDGLKKAAGGFEVVSGQGLIDACRQIKSPAELALLQLANNITIEAFRQTHGQVQLGMTGHDVSALMTKAFAAMGYQGGGLALLNEASANPHGSKFPQTVKEGSVILIDTGISVEGYESDITRTWFYGEPSAKARKVWNTVKRGQEIALETARIGVPIGSLDKAVRAYYDKEGWGPGYKLPGMSHRTGHGIGMDGHESPFLVLSDATPLAAGMCFSDEPGIYIPGEFGIRLEDCWYMTEQGAKLFTPLAKSVEDPI